MMQMQTLASEILSMERGHSKSETGKEHLERNDFIIEKQRAELERIEAERQHKEHQIDLAEQELKVHSKKYTLHALWFDCNFAPA